MLGHVHQLRARARRRSHASQNCPPSLSPGRIRGSIVVSFEWATIKATIKAGGRNQVKRPTSLPVRNDGRGPSRGSRKSSRWNFFVPGQWFFLQSAAAAHCHHVFGEVSLPPLLPPLLCLPPFFRRPSRRFPPPPNRRRFSLVSARACDRSLRPARHGVSGQRGIARSSLGLS